MALRFRPWRNHYALAEAPVRRVRRFVVEASGMHPSQMKPRVRPHSASESKQVSVYKYIPLKPEADGEGGGKPCVHVTLAAQHLYACSSYTTIGGGWCGSQVTTRTSRVVARPDFAWRIGQVCGGLFLVRGLLSSTRTTHSTEAADGFCPVASATPPPKPATLGFFETQRAMKRSGMPQTRTWATFRISVF